MQLMDTADNRDFIPDGWHAITPRIAAQDAKRLVGFLAQVFGATGDFQEARPSTIRVDDSVLMVSETGPRRPMPAFLYVYVRDCDATFRRAVELGAHAVEEPFDTPYGDRRCMVEDEWGNTWQVATQAKRRSAV